MKGVQIDALRASTLEFIEDMIIQYVGDSDGESPIEKLFLIALKTRIFINATEFKFLDIVENEEAETRTLAHFGKYNSENGSIPGAFRLILRQQAQLNDRRVDFLIHALDWRNLADVKWRKLIVECDGHDFHERTKQQAKRDRSRDRRAIMEGFDCFRFTGSEIWNDPWTCATEITDWAVQGWG